MNWKKILFITFNVVLGVYVVVAMTMLNHPYEESICRDVHVNIEEGIVDGFLSPADVRQMLQADALNPVGQSMERIDLRKMEEYLQGKELIEAAQCYKGQDGVVCINIRQRIPVVRVMNSRGEDYCVDSHGKPMPRTDYTCNLILATGQISKAYAEKWLTPLANTVLEDPFWKHQVVQLNVLADGSVEIIPRVGGHIVYLGMPTGISNKLDRVLKFYRYGLTEAGWNKYSRISVEFDNQIVCKRKQ